MEIKMKHSDYTQLLREKREFKESNAINISAVSMIISFLQNESDIDRCMKYIDSLGYEKNSIDETAQGLVLTLLEKQLSRI